MKYRKKLVFVEAMEWNGKDHRNMYEFLESPEIALMHSIDSTGTNFYIDHVKVKGGLIIKTLEGEHLANIGDFIIKGVAGEFYPCKPEIFAKTYELANKE